MCMTHTNSVAPTALAERKQGEKHVENDQQRKRERKKMTIPTGVVLKDRYGGRRAGGWGRGGGRRGEEVEYANKQVTVKDILSVPKLTRFQKYGVGGGAALTITT